MPLSERKEILLEKRACASRCSYIQDKRPFSIRCLIVQVEGRIEAWIREDSITAFGDKLTGQVSASLIVGDRDEAGDC
jgi:hypothetical protein